MPQKRPLSASFCPRGGRRQAHGGGRAELESAQLQLHSAPPTFSPNCGTTCASFWRSPSGLRRERWFSSALPSLAQVTHSLAPPGTCLSVSLEGGAGAWAGRERGGPILTPALPRGAAGQSTASPKTSFLSLSHALIHSFICSFTFNRYLLSKAPFNGAEAAWVYKVDKAPCHGPILLREGR